MVDARRSRSPAADLLSRVKKSSAAFFEHLVVDLLLKVGYGGSLIDFGLGVTEASLYQIKRIDSDDFGEE
jgi:restriction system protein